ncbi:MAG TPA: hypothetical protein VGU20_23685 [Stellaceae bacterium]|nr:hypothetical protein [Stellaceae bacterium]
MLQPLLLSILDRPCLARAMRDGAVADKALAEDEYHAVIIDMTVPGVDPLALAKRAAARGTILVPEMPAQFQAAAARVTSSCASRCAPSACSSWCAKPAPALSRAKARHEAPLQEPPRWAIARSEFVSDTER